MNVYRLIGLAMILIAAMLLAGCGEGGGSSSLRSRINAGAPARTPAPTPAPSETPDIAPQMVEVTRIVEIAQPAQVIEVPATVVVTREIVQVQLVEVTSTPQPVPTCDPRTPAPTIALDASDMTAGVVLRGQWPCWSVQ